MATHRLSRHRGSGSAFRGPLLGTLLALAAVLPCRAADDPFSLADSLARGRFTLELRPRYNHIKESDKPTVTEGTTVRVVAGWQSAPWRGAKVVAEALHTGHLGTRRYNDNVMRAATSRYPLLPDPGYTGANQLYVDVALHESTSVRAGRQLVRLDNLRFISDNDFRQTPLVFTGVMVTHTGIENTQLKAGHFTRVRTAVGAYNPLDLTLLHAAWNPARGHSIAAYAYLQDQPLSGGNTGFANNSNRIAGLRAEGGISTGGFEFPYIAEWATQRPYAGGNYRIDARYRRLGGGIGGNGWVVRYDDEVKGSNAGLYGLQTPFTDLYAFNGWALHFTSTPRQGLRDRWATLRWQPGAVTFYAEAHRFASDVGGLDFGRETDLSASYPVLDNAVLRLQHARYRPKDGPVTQNRVDKTWLTLTYTY